MLSMVAALVLGVAPAAASTGPTVVSGFRDGPIAVPDGAFGAMASLKVGAGSWYIVAKGYVSFNGDTVCHLVAGHDVDVSEADNSDEYLSVLMTLVHSFASAGSVRVLCESDSSGVSLNMLKITATRAGKLTSGVIGSSSTTKGSGLPRIISAKRDADVEVLGDGKWHQVGSVQLPAGPWWSVATAITRASAQPQSAIHGTCELRAGADFDQTIFTVLRSGGLSQTVGEQVVHAFASPGVAALYCSADSGTLLVSNVRITGMRAGTLTNRHLRTTDSTTWGTGWPRIISGWDDGPTSVAPSEQYQTIETIDVPAGQWAVFAKLSASRSAFTIQCRLDLVGDWDTALTSTVARNVPIYLDAVHSFVSGGTVRLRCQSEVSTTIAFVKITAVRAGSLTNTAL